MPTALEAAAEQIAPARAGSNYFDPAASQSVISRYANAGREVQDAGLASEAADRLLRSREDRLTRQRNTVLWGRDEQEYAEKQEFKAQRGQFLETISSLNPEADDFEKQLSDLYKTLPPAAIEDDAVGAIIGWKQKVYQDRLNERDMVTRSEDAFNRRLELENRKAKTKTLLSGLAPEEIDSLRDPVTGEVDMDEAIYLAGQRSRENKKADQLDVAAEKRRWKIEDAKDVDLSPRLREQKILAKEHAEGDPEAFPSQLDSLRTALSTKDEKGNLKPPSDDKLKKDPRYEAARRYESKKFISELESARNTPDIEKYVAMASPPGAPPISDAAKEKRRTLWRVANAADAAGTVSTTPPAPEGTVEDYVPPAAPVAAPPPAGLPEGTQIREKDGVRYARTPDGKVFRITE